MGREHKLGQVYECRGTVSELRSGLVRETDAGFRLHKEVEAFVEYVSPTKAEDEVRGLVVNLITRAVTRNFPDAKVLPFGSFETKLYLPSG